MMLAQERTTMSPLEELVAGCRASVSVEVNMHRDYHVTIREHIESNGGKDDVSPEMLVEMLEKDSCVCIQFYPLTPIGSYTVWHHDVEAGLQKAVEVLRHHWKISRVNGVSPA